MKGLWPSTPRTCGSENDVLRRLCAVFMQRIGLCLNSKLRIKTFNKGSLGSRIDEERSEARNVV